MAGIGFELKKLFQEKSAAGYLKAYTYTAIVTAGPFVLMTGMILLVQIMFNIFDIGYAQKELYTLSIIYPFVFSHIISSGFSMLITRYLADLLYNENYDEIAPSLYGILSLTLFVGSILAIAFFWNKPLDIVLKFLTYTFFMQMIIIWIEGVYLSALKDYVKILKAYLIGAAVGVSFSLLVFYFKFLPIIYGVLLAMNLGAFFTTFLLFAGIEKFFKKNNYKNYLFLASFEEIQRLFFVNFFYTLSVYIPNIIVWQGPLGVENNGTYLYAPIYDVATFYAFLSILPVVIIFVVATEINFYEKYATCFMYITGKGNLREIENSCKDMLFVLWAELRNIFELQFVFSIIFIAVGNYIMPKLGNTGELISMYNLIVFAAYCTGMLQLITIFLLYFEDKMGALYVCSFFLFTNILFNIVGSIFFGEVSYGFTFFLSAFISLVVALWRLQFFAKRLIYFIFCSQPLFYKKKNGIFSKIAYWLHSQPEVEKKIYAKDI